MGNFQGLSVSSIAVALLLAGCATPADVNSSASAGATWRTSSPSSSPLITLTGTERVTKAEAAAKAELPDAPIWEGMTFAGVVVNETEVCVDRTWAPGGGIDKKGGSAGYVIVSFPDETVGSPETGLCAEYASKDPKQPTTVNVPDELVNNPGLLVSTKFGDKWPLTVTYVVARCERITVSGRSLQVATLEAPDGKKYAANGTAKDHGGYPGAEPIWAPDPIAPGLRIDLSPVTDAALKLCG
ncbi:DUF2511 domain-containing protein [Paenarthrobacter sp. C1]|uniref:DUF2511 domain-containing protein n=1 Tax=Paenarthrobacter sp. C1 TaxID=3400220 RepID=UPI003BF603EA